MSPRLPAAVFLCLGLAACTGPSSHTTSTRPWVQAGDREPPQQEVAQESDRQHDPVTRTLVRMGRQMHNELPSEGYTF